MSNDVRNKVINNRLMTMAKLAKDLADSGWSRCEQAENDRYIRINGDGYQAVSLKDETALCGYGKKTKKLEKVQNNFHLNLVCNVEAIKKKRERRLQAYLIKQALSNDGSLIPAIPCLVIAFSELIFVTDEISFGDKNTDGATRIDILAIGKLKGTASDSADYVPVCIELKHVRSLEIDGQLKRAVNSVCGEGVNKTDRRHHIGTLINVFVGSNLQIDFDEVRKIIVWPAYDLYGLRNTDIDDEIYLAEYFTKSDGKNFENPADLIWKFI